MTKLIILHYGNLLDDATPAPHVILARRGADGTFEQVGHVGGGEVSALRLIGVAAVSRPHVELFGSDALKPPHFFPAHDFFAAPSKFVGYYPQFFGLSDAPEDERWLENIVEEDSEVDHEFDYDDVIQLMRVAVDASAPTMFGYGLPIAAITMQTIEDLPRGDAPTGTETADQ